MDGVSKEVCDARIDSIHSKLSDIEKRQDRMENKLDILVERTGESRGFKAAMPYAFSVVLFAIAVASFYLKLKGG